MRKLGMIRMTQHTPIGDDQSEISRIYLITIAYDEADFVTSKELRKLYSEGTPAEVIGYYEIVYPEIMAGNWSQIIDEFRSMSEVQAEKDELIIYDDNNGGTYVNRSKCV
jgi:hypothetical protein